MAHVLCSHILHYNFLNPVINNDIPKNGIFGFHFNTSKKKKYNSFINENQYHHNHQNDRSKSQFIASVSKEVKLIKKLGIIIFIDIINFVFLENIDGSILYVFDTVSVSKKPYHHHSIESIKKFLLNYLVFFIITKYLESIAIVESDKDVIGQEVKSGALPQLTVSQLIIFL